MHRLTEGLQYGESFVINALRGNIGKLCGKTGIFGKAAGPLGDRRLDTGTVTTGKASILCTLQGRRCEEAS